MIRFLIISVLSVSLLLCSTTRHASAYSDEGIRAEMADQQQDSGEDSSPEESVPSYLDVFSPANVIAKLQLQFFLLFEIKLVTDTPSYPSIFSSVPLLDAGFIKTLFRQYISANAP